MYLNDLKSICASNHIESNFHCNLIFEFIVVFRHKKKKYMFYHRGTIRRFFFFFFFFSVELQYRFGIYPLKASNTALQ